MSYGANYTNAKGAMMALYSVVEDGKEIQTVASLSGAAMLWAENRARRVFEMVPSGPPGPDAWQRGHELSAEELNAALTIRI
jgi:adenine deaminase